MNVLLRRLLRILREPTQLGRPLMIEFDEDHRMENWLVQSPSIADSGGHQDGAITREMAIVGLKRDARAGIF